MILWIILAIVVLLVLFVVMKYNSFIRMDNKVDEAFSTMDVCLKKRYDLIPNLVETVKGYTKHESETLENVIGARNMAVKSQGMEEKVHNDMNLQSMLGPLYAISEQYPDLKADKQFMSLQSDLQKIETEIAQSRKYYNAICLNYNNGIEQFPTNVLANMFKFKEKPLYEIIESNEREAVKVSF